MIEILCKSPRDCSAADLASFCNLVRLGGQVNNAVLEAGVKRARSLAFALAAGRVVGAGGLKVPLLNYRDKVFRKAAVEGATEFRLEFGWVFVLPEHRKLGLSTAIASELLKDEAGQLYASSVTTNDAMHRTLFRLGFRRVGHPYPSGEHADEELALFVRDGAVK